jgi:hypothetical protein
MVLSTTAGYDTARTQSLAQTWIDVQTSGPFVCRANFALDDHQELLGQLAELQNDVALALGVERPQQHIEMYLFGDEPAFRRFLSARMPQVSNRRALFVKGAGAGQIFVYRNQTLDIDVRHESTHALLHASLPFVPLWLDEGLAEYFEVVPESRPFRRDYLNKTKWSVRLGAAPRLVQLEAIRQLKDMDESDYRGAWAWVHFMLHGPPEAHEELLAFLADIHAHSPPGRLSERLNDRLPGVDRRMADHFKSWAIPRPPDKSR